MAKLTALQRHHLKPSQFGLPGGRYPLNDANHARNALARAAQNATPAEQAEIKAKVHAKYPEIGKTVSKYRNGGSVQHKFKMAPHASAPQVVAPQTNQTPPPMPEPSSNEPDTNMYGIPLQQPMSVNQQRMVRR